MGLFHPLLDRKCNFRSFNQASVGSQQQECGKISMFHFIFYNLHFLFQATQPAF